MHKFLYMFYIILYESNNFIAFLTKIATQKKRQEPFFKGFGVLFITKDGNLHSNTCLYIYVRLLFSSFMKYLFIAQKK